MESYGPIRDLIKSCLLPELTQDLDSIPIERDHFNSYLECLKLQLPILYDWIQQQQCQNSFFEANDNENRIRQEIRAHLIVLFCEISFPHSIYHLNNIDLIRNADKLLESYSYDFPKEIEEMIFKYYEETLHKDKWKRQLGAVHGFVRYLELFFNSSRVKENRMSHTFLTFCLAVALNIRAYYEVHYKTLSTSIFLIMLQNGSHDDIISMNIHSVIYDAVFKDIHIMDTEVFISKQWNCLIKCLDFYKDFDSFTNIPAYIIFYISKQIYYQWNYLDDMMEALLRKISLASDSAASICLIKFVGKLVVYFTINYREIEQMLAIDITTQNVDRFRSVGSTNTSYTNYRWCKTILQMFIIESHKLLQTKDVCFQLIQEMHKIYIVAILPIRLCIIEPILVTFLEKFIAVLMESIKTHKFENKIVQAITCSLETINFHIQNADKSSSLHKFKESIDSLLKTKAFEKSSSVQ